MNRPLLILGALLLPAFAQDNPLPRSTTVTVNGFKFEMKNCQKTSTKSVTCNFMVTNLQADRVVYLTAAWNDGSYFVDSAGMQIRATRAQLGSATREGRASTETVTDVAVKASLDFGVGDPKATSLAKLSILLHCDNKEFRAEFRRIPLEGS